MPNSELTHDHLKRFFYEKFHHSDFKNNVPDKPSLEIMSEEIFGYPPSDEQTKEMKSQAEAGRIREQMMGYADAIIER